VYAMGWMYRNNDLTAAFGRAQLQRLDRNLARQIDNAELVLAELVGTPGLVSPTVPRDCRHTWYNQVYRLDMAALASPLPPVEARDALAKAMQAEGVPAVVWQHFILPAMTVFQARNGYGKGCPWRCPNAAPVTYDVTRYPVAQKHCDTHFCIVQPLRAPNGAMQTKLLAAGIRKVLEGAAEVWAQARPSGA
jgi:perosamine synthetase